MKQLTLFFSFCACLLLTTNVCAQAQARDPRLDCFNVVKSNLLSPLSLGYERGFGRHFSLTAYLLYLPAFDFGAPTDPLGYVSLSDPSKGLTIEARLYTSKTKAPLNGFYVGGYYLTRVADVFAHKITTSGVNQADIKAYIPSDLTSYGLMIGKQKIRPAGFTTDFNFGVGYYSIGNIPAFTGEDSEAFKLMSRLSKLRSGIGPRLNFCLGYAF
jgi:hypothetical protein